jgi:hypothetical protein
VKTVTQILHFVDVQLAIGEQARNQEKSLGHKERAAQIQVALNAYWSVRDFISPPPPPPDPNQMGLFHE